MAGFIKKNWQKDSTNVLINAGMRAAGAVGGAFIANQGPFKMPASKTESMFLYNIGGPVLLAAGVLGDMVLEDEKFKSLCQGIATYGALHSIAVISKGKDGSGGLAEKLGISGLGSTEAEEDAELMSGIAALGTTEETEDEAAIKALAAGETKTDDGNDWAYVAENVDSADQITKPAVSGVDETAAELMGVDTQEEAALLMGMF